MFVRLFVFSAVLLLASCRPSATAPAPTPAIMAALAQDAVNQAQGQFQVSLDYSEASIAKVESILAQLGTSLPDPKREQQAMLWGAYIGEVARRHHGGAWVVPSDGPFTGVITLQAADGNSFSPPAKVHKRLTNGDEDNVAFYYRVMFNRDKKN